MTFAGVEKVGEGFDNWIMAGWGGIEGFGQLDLASFQFFQLDSDLCKTCHKGRNRPSTYGVRILVNDQPNQTKPS